MVHTDPHSARFRSTVSLLARIGVQRLVPHHVVGPVPSVGMTGAAMQARFRSSHWFAMRRAWQRASLDPGPADGYVLITEDDIALQPSVNLSLVLPALSCAAYLSARADLPFFVGGICGGGCVRHRGGVAGGPRTWTLQAESQPIEFARWAGYCAHFVAVRRSSVPWLLDASGPNITADQRGRRGQGAHAMDVHTVRMARQLGGVVLAGSHIFSSEGRGLFFQDRSQFGSHNPETTAWTTTRFVPRMVPRRSPRKNATARSPQKS